METRRNNKLSKISVTDCRFPLKMDGDFMGTSRQHKARKTSDMLSSLNY